MVDLIDFNESNVNQINSLRSENFKSKFEEVKRFNKLKNKNISYSPGNKENEIKINQKDITNKTNINSPNSNANIKSNNENKISKLLKEKQVSCFLYNNYLYF